jgi:hypothetical protein
MDFPILDMNDPDFKENLAFNIWSTHGSSDYRNDRERPYNGQPWTDEGERGKTEVKGLTMRDIRDCMVKAILQCAPCEEYLKAENFTKCWDFSQEPHKATQFLLDRQKDHPDYLCTKVETGTWRYQDIYQVDLSKVDPGAIAKNLTCEIEKMMGIFPNVQIFTHEEPRHLD